MAVLSRILATALLLASASASPAQIDTIRRLLGRDTFEWTALGDSYSSGVGAGDYIGGSYRCLRYQQAYPLLINGDDRLHEGERKINDVVCSGSKTTDVNEKQLLDEDEPDRGGQFGKRPKFGNPSMATLSIGGNDIDFPGILRNCILEFTLYGGAQQNCEKQKEQTWALLANVPELAGKISGTIQKIVEKGRKGSAGDKFKLYVTGFPRFFNDKTEACNKVTFARTANPKDDNKPHILLTNEVREEYNKMSEQLNIGIESAVKENKDKGVYWVPIDQAMDGHRFCEEGINEPDQRNEKLWLFHYPYNEPESQDMMDTLEQAESKTTPKDGETFSTYENRIFENVEFNDPGNRDVLRDSFFSGIGKRVKVFHPQVALHEKIRDLVLEEYIKHLEQEQVPDPPKQDENKCHGISGDYWVMSRDQAVDNVKDFCKGDQSKAVYNKDSVNELELVVMKDGEEKPAKDSPDCEGRFTRAVIDGCDGDDSTNNPHNYKFGSTLNAGDGWSYKMTPLSKQVNEVSCDVSYKFLWNEVQIRGKNLPDAKLGANGEGLKKELEGCGGLSKWKFERTPDDVKFQWYASCRLLIGTKACAGRALESAGGSGKGNCHGAGKRSWAEAMGIVSPVKRDSIDDWPGYGDEGRHIFASDLEPAVDKRDDIDNWPGYGDEGRHVFASDETE